MENMQDYVIRKLKEESTNLAYITKMTKISRATLYRIMEGGETSFTKIDSLNNFFKKSAD